MPELDFFGEVLLPKLRKIEIIITGCSETQFFVWVSQKVNSPQSVNAICHPEYLVIEDCGDGKEKKPLTMFLRFYWCSVVKTKTRKCQEINLQHWWQQLESGTSLEESPSALSTVSSCVSCESTFMIHFLLKLNLNHHLFYL